MPPVCWARVDFPQPNLRRMHSTIAKVTSVCARPQCRPLVASFTPIRSDDRDDAAVRSLLLLRPVDVSF
jgi:hypothetical protein